MGVLLRVAGCGARRSRPEVFIATGDRVGMFRRFACADGKGLLYEQLTDVWLYVPIETS